MNTQRLLVATMALSLTLVGMTAKASSTADLVADINFDFRTDRDISLNLTAIPAGKGRVNVYYGYEHYDAAANAYYPDPKTRVLNFSAQATNQVSLQVNKNWQYLIIEYVPMNAAGVEQYKKVDLTTASTVSVNF